jgi:hypothetical protein
MPTTAATTDARALSRRIVECRTACTQALLASKEGKVSTDECVSLLVDATDLAAQLNGLAHYAEVEAAREALSTIRKKRVEALDALDKAMLAVSQDDIEKTLACHRQVIVETLRINFVLWSVVNC